MTRVENFKSPGRKTCRGQQVIKKTSSRSSRTCEESIQKPVLHQDKRDHLPLGQQASRRRARDVERTKTMTVHERGPAGGAFESKSARRDGHPRFTGSLREACGGRGPTRCPGQSGISLPFQQLCPAFSSHLCPPKAGRGRIADGRQA